MCYGQNQTSDCEQELERLREEIRQRDEREEREQRDRDYLARQRYEESLLEASTWPEALEKNQKRINRDVQEYRKFDREYGTIQGKEPGDALTPDDYYFEDALAAIAIARTMWGISARKYASRMAELRREIEAVEREIPKDVAAQLRRHNNHDRPGWMWVIEALETGQPNDFVYW